jgi:hypothetical protein
MESHPGTLRFKNRLFSYPEYIRHRKDFPLSFLSTFNSGTLMLYVDYIFEAGNYSFQAWIEIQSSGRRIISVESETVVKTEQGIYPFTFEWIVQRIFTLLAFNIICTLKSATLKYGVPP